MLSNVDFVPGLMPVQQVQPKVKKVKKVTRKKKGDKPKQKRAPTAFILFSNAQRPEVKAKWPNVTFSEYGKIIGEMWAGLDANHKKVWTDMAAERKREIDIQKPPKISRPPTPYQLFCAEVRVHIKRDNPDITFGETGRLLGSKWAALDENTKQGFVLAAAEKKQNWPPKVQGVPTMMQYGMVGQEEDDDDDDDDDDDEDDE
jgi:hypothetical protein